MAKRKTYREPVTDEPQEEAPQETPSLLNPKYLISKYEKIVKVGGKSYQGYLYSPLSRERTDAGEPQRTATTALEQADSERARLLIEYEAALQSMVA